MFAVLSWLGGAPSSLRPRSCSMRTRPVDIHAMCDDLLRIELGLPSIELCAALLELSEALC